MNSIKEVLGFVPPNVAFKLAARHLLSDNQKDKIKESARQLIGVAQSLSVVAEDVPDADAIESAYKKFCSLCSGRNVVLTSRELRYITYVMGRIKNPDNMMVLVHLLNKNWKARYLNGIFLFLLTNWDSYESSVLDIIRNFYHEKLILYSGKREKLLLLQKNAQFLKANGGELLGTYLRIKNKALLSVCQDVFGMSSTHIEYEYFSRVIVAYFEKSTNEAIPQIENVLQRHNNPITAKRLIPNLIIYNEKTQNTMSSSALKHLALKYIGDPSIRAKWKIVNGSEEDCRKLEEAREIMSNWLKKEFISLFFEKCVNEPGRKAYWLERTKIIYDFKIYTTRFVYDMILSKDEVLANFLDSNVTTLRLEAYDKRAALVLDIGNYLVVEFSDVGAIYIYKKGGIFSRYIEIGNITYLKELKKTNLGYLNATNLSPFSEEGRMIHNSGWEKKMDSWLENYGVL